MFLNKSSFGNDWFFFVEIPWYIICISSYSKALINANTKNSHTSSNWKLNIILQFYVWFMLAQKIFWSQIRTKKRRKCNLQKLIKERFHKEGENYCPEQCNSFKHFWYSRKFLHNKEKCIFYIFKSFNKININFNHSYYFHNINGFIEEKVI